jgi:hypothetical protein
MKKIYLQQLPNWYPNLLALEEKRVDVCKDARTGRHVYYPSSPMRSPLRAIIFLHGLEKKGGKIGF